ncbi:hypothetical protein LCGC14_2848280 [marine sediment metagenome]|uniref:Uncharacterized protein n=1 Tax=marine sediment metagenome TaxID=412755 RepID=A0A0F8YVZ1_9ZZZZ
MSDHCNCSHGDERRRAEKAERERDEARHWLKLHHDNGWVMQSVANEAKITRVTAVMALRDRKEWWAGHSSHAKAAVGKLLDELESALQEEA